MIAESSRILKSQILNPIQDPVRQYKKEPYLTVPLTSVQHLIVAPKDVWLDGKRGFCYMKPNLSSLFDSSLNREECCEFSGVKSFPHYSFLLFNHLLGRLLNSNF